MNEPVIIVGGGTAGLTAALTVAKAGGEAILVAGSIGGGSSPWAQGGIAAAVGDDDEPGFHLDDTLACGGDLVDVTAAKVLTDDAPARMADLVAAGVPFDRDENGKLSLGLEGGHHRRRIIHAGGGATGWHVIQTLSERVRNTPGITILEGYTALSLVLANGAVRGITVGPLSGDGPSQTLTGTVILATGGCGGLFGRSTNPDSVNGSGIALAWEAGAIIADLEFVQFHPTALDLPAPELGGRALLLTEALRGEGAHLLDAKGRRFLVEGPLANPLAELAPRDQVARAIHRARAEGPVYLTLRHVDADAIRKHFPNLVELLRPLGLDLATDMLPVAPAAHYLMGGVLSDTDGATSVDGLFVAGEVACTGVQGANRLASNSLLECLVFGRRAGLAAMAGRGAAGFAPAMAGGRRLDGPLPVGSEAGLRTLGATLDRHLGVERNEPGILAALAQLPEIGSGVVARRIATGAFLRQESRGAHYRSDFPALSLAWQGRILQRKGVSPAFVRLEALAPAAVAP